MIALLISVLVAGAGGILVYLFRETIGAKLFPKPPSPEQQAANMQAAEDKPIVSPPSQNQTEKNLNDGKF